MTGIGFSKSVKYLLFFLLILICACKTTSTPKPRGYFRIDFPEKQYQKFQSDCKFSFEVPVYAKVEKSELRTAEPCWYNVKFKGYGATLHLTYKSLENSNVAQYSEDVRRIVYKHIVKADDIIESIIYDPESEVYGFVYDIKGNAASSLNFYITDSISGFLNGSLYFNVEPNVDSLGPSIDFFRKDIIHLINSFEWE